MVEQFFQEDDLANVNDDDNDNDKSNNNTM